MTAQGLTMQEEELSITAKIRKISDILSEINTEYKREWRDALRCSAENGIFVEFRCPITGCRVTIFNLKDGEVIIDCDDNEENWKSFLIGYNLY